MWDLDVRLMPVWVSCGVSGLLSVQQANDTQIVRVWLFVSVLALSVSTGRVNNLTNECIVMVTQPPPPPKQVHPPERFISIHEEHFPHCMCCLHETFLRQFQRGHRQSRFLNIYFIYKVFRKENPHADTQQC